jgi:hypothetical protein
MVVKGERRWSKVWRSLRAESRLPRIDFSRQMLLVASQGRQPSGGHLLRITGVEASGGALLVDVTEVSPGEGCVTAGVITSPLSVQGPAVKRGSEILGSWRCGPGGACGRFAVLIVCARMPSLISVHGPVVRRGRRHDG